jgi:hypothetical protein
MFNHTEITGSIAAIGFYTLSKILGFVQPAVAAVALKDSWHFQALQELALLATIVSAGVAVFTFHRNFIKGKKKDKE